MPGNYFKTNTDFGSRLFVKTASGIQGIDLLKDYLGADLSKVGSGYSSTGQAAEAAKAKLLSEKGIDYNRLPIYTPGNNEKINWQRNAGSFFSQPSVPVPAADRYGNAPITQDPSLAGYRNPNVDYFKTAGGIKTYITPSGVQIQLDQQGNVVSQTLPDITTPPTNKKFQETDVYKTLSAEEKEIADLLFNVISIGGEAEATTFANAIQQSIAVAEPWAKAQAAMALAEFAGAVDESIFGFQAKTEAIQRARDILAKDVTNQKEFLTLEQQSEVARQVSKYDEDLLSIADQAAEKGITFATGARSRQLAETRRTEQFQDVIQSSRRRTNFQIKELELKAARGDVSAQKQLETLSGEQGFALRRIGRSAEEILGSERARQFGIAGFTPVGGVQGKIAEEKEKRIISDVGGIVGLTDLLTT